LADKALRISPNLGEAHLAQGLYFYRAEGNYPEALKELVIAGSALPNDPEILDASGYIYRRQGRWREALNAFRRAQELDPRRGHFDGLPDTLRMLREWGPASEACKSALQIEPQSFDGWLTLAYIQFGQSRNPSIAAETLDRMPEMLRKKPGAKLARWDFAMLARDFDAASQNAPDQPLEEFPVIEPKAFYQACIAFAQGDIELARRLLEGIRPLYETGVREHPEEAPFHSVLAKLYVLLGRKEEAIREAQRAVELCPESKDAVSGPIYATDLAFVYAQSGEVARAVTLLSRLLTTPAGARGVTQAHLRLSWEWDPIRKDPRFQAILESPEPKTIYK
jgi:tetratricopeptide (TPR) repeat protein